MTAPPSDPGPETPDRRRFAVLAVVWFSYLMVYLARLSVGPLSPFLKDSFDLSSAQVGALMSATAVSYAPTLIAAGWLVDRVGVRHMLSAGTFITALCALLMFFAESYVTLLVLLVLSGVGAGCIYPSAVKAVIMWFPVGERATAIGVNQTAINISGIVGATTLPSVATSLGWEYGFLTVGVFGLAICAVAALGYRNPPGVIRPRLGEHRDRPALRQILGLRDVWFLALMGLFLGIVEFSALAHLVLFARDEYLLSAVAAGGLLALCEAAGAVGKPLSGLVSDRLLGGRRRPPLMVLATLTLAANVILALGGRDLGWALYPTVALLGFAAVGWGGVFGTAAGEIGGRDAAGQVAGLTGALVNVGIVIGPPAFGAVIDSSGSYGVAWLLMAASAVAAMACIALLREPREHTGLRPDAGFTEA